MRFDKEGLRYELNTAESRWKARWSDRSHILRSFPIISDESWKCICVLYAFPWYGRL